MKKTGLIAGLLFLIAIVFSGCTDDNKEVCYTCVQKNSNTGAVVKTEVVCGEEGENVDGKWVSSHSGSGFTASCN